MELFSGPLSPSISDLNKLVNAINSGGSSVTSLGQLTDVLVDNDDDMFLSGSRPADIVDGTAASNTALGSLSLVSITTGNNNSSLGSYALNLLTTASNNTAVGTDSLSAVTTGDNNTAIGDESGATVTTGTSNTLIGTSTATSAATGINQIAIGYQATATGDNKAQIGNASITDVYLGDATAKLHADISLCTGGGFAPNAHDSLFAGDTTGASNTGAQNNVIGSDSLLAVGNGFANNGVGANSLPLLTTGLANSYIGDSCGLNITTGHHNSLLGSNTGVTTATAHHRLAIGVGAIAATDNAGVVGDADFTNLIIGGGAGTIQTANSSITHGSAPWAFGTVFTATSTLDTTKYVEVLINGSLVKLCIST